MRRAIIAAVVVGIAGALAMACAQGPKALKTSKGKKGGPRAYVFLNIIDDGTCQATDWVGTIGGAKDTRITWYLTNNCTTNQFVTITNYQQEIGGDPNNLGSAVNDVMDSDPAYYDNLAPGDQDKKLDAKIIKTGNGSGTFFKYSICVGDSHGKKAYCLDPDVDVWP
jgi:hypothetical protein